MIYLIDDNLNSLRERYYGVDYICNGAFNDVLTSLEVLSNSTTIDFSYDCFLIHTTTNDSDSSGNSIPGKNAIVKRIMEHLVNNLPSKPLVFFSGSMPEVANFNYSEDPNRIYQIKKSTFYSHLKPFLENYRISKQIELRIIAYGKNYKYKELLDISQPLMDYMREFDADRIEPNQISYTLLTDYYYAAEIKAPLTDFLYKFKENSFEKNELINLIQSINDSFINYGKNIYS